jgi:hypothetical protein
MEITCTRCHQAIEDGSTYCAMCGLPQLVYQAEAGAGVAQPEKRTEPVRDAASIAWKTAMSISAKLAVPAGTVLAFFFLYSIVNESSFLGLLFLMAAAAAWVVAIYKRNQKPAWITIGAGARIGLVTGIMSAWTATAICGLLMFGARYWFGYGVFIDGFWTKYVAQMTEVWSAIGLDAPTVAVLKANALTPQGRAEASLSMTGGLASALLVFAIAGGALGARFLARPRQPEV